jgi:hypothetical protein
MVTGPGPQIFTSEVVNAALTVGQLAEAEIVNALKKKNKIERSKGFIILLATVVPGTCRAIKVEN